MREHLTAAFLNTAAEITFRTRFRGANGAGPFVDLRLLNVKDRFGDVLGTLVLAKAVSGQKTLVEAYRLTGRELEVLQYLIAGNTNKEIARFLAIAERTVKTHVQNIFNKVGADTRTELIYLLSDRKNL